MYKNHSDDQLTSGNLTQAECGKKRTRAAAPPVPSPAREPDHVTKTTAAVEVETESKGLQDKPVVGSVPVREFTFEVIAKNKRKSTK